MYKSIILFLLFATNFYSCAGQKKSATKSVTPNSEIKDVIEIWDQEPSIVTVSDRGIPSDAIVLFDGTNWSNWVHQNSGRPVEWNLIGGVGVVKPSTGGIVTKQKFSDCQLHLEWSAPTDTAGLTSQGRGNSGVFFQTQYEIQILDSYKNKTYNNGQAGSVYKQHIPLANVTRPPGEWQVYDIIYKAPTFDDDGNLNTPAYFTVLHNGVLVQNHADVKGVTVHKGKPTYKAHGAMPILLQDHGNEMRFRNIWVRAL